MPRQSHVAAKTKKEIPALIIHGERKNIAVSRPLVLLPARALPGVPRRRQRACIIVRVEISM